VSGKIVFGSTVNPLSTLPRANKVDPLRVEYSKLHDWLSCNSKAEEYNVSQQQHTPPPIREEDAGKGILSLIERGLIPLHKAEQQFSASEAPPPNDFVGIGGYNLSIVKMDPSEIQAVKQAMHLERNRMVKSPSQQQIVSNKGSAQNLETKSYLNEVVEGTSRIPVPASTPANELKSIHTFVVQNGKTKVTSQDYLNFKQHYCLSWGSILTLILNLEEFLKNYRIPIAFIDGDRLADLSLVFELGQTPTFQHFLSCILNAEDVENIFKMPGRRYLGPKGTDMAAIKIQSTWRRYKDRSAYLQYRKRKWAAGVIAISWIMSCKISMVRKQLRETRKLQLRRFKMRNKEFRENWPHIKNSRRVIIHLPSLGYPQHIREGLSEINILQNLQMTRLCDIIDPNVHVIYVSPVKLNEEVYQYYHKLLGMKAQSSCSDSSSNKEDNEDFENRYKVVVPDAVDRFPVSTCMLYSLSSSISVLKKIIKGQDAYIVPGVLHKDDIYVADLLGIPVLGPEPDVASLYSSKSGSKRIFLSAKVDIPPGQFDIYSLPQLHESIAKLVTENLYVKRWLFKMDNEFDGRGTAYCDVTAHLACYSWALRECQRYGDKWSKTWAHEPTLIRVSAEIPEIIAQCATPVNNELYPTWNSFLQDFLKRGGIVEACPPSDSVTALSVDVLIEPSGESTILSIGDQTSVDPVVICDATEAISNACKVRNVMGYFSIDFITFIDPISMDQVAWAIDLKLRYSDSLAMARLMCYVSAGHFDPSLSAFTLPVKTTKERRRQRRQTFDQDMIPPNANRYAIISTRLTHSNLSVIHYSVFFQMCRAHGIGFDLKEKAGTIFTLVDSSKREHLGIVMSDDLQGSLSTFARNLSVIHQEISAPNMQGESNFQEQQKKINRL
ncbi:IQ domain-containing protein H, partial [Acropora cervicornis]